MKNFFKAFRIIAIVAMIGIGLAGCDNGSDDDGSGGGGGGNVPSELIGIWYSHVSKDSLYFAFEFTSAGVKTTPDTDYAYTVSIKDGDIYYKGQYDTEESLLIGKYKVDGDTLTGSLYSSSVNRTWYR